MKRKNFKKAIGIHITKVIKAEGNVKTVFCSKRPKTRSLCRLKVGLNNLGRGTFLAKQKRTKKEIRSQGK